MTNLEKEILSAAQTSISTAIKSSLEGYNSPLNKYVVSIVEGHEAELRKIIEDGISTAILSNDFKKAAKDAFTHKLAKALVQKLEGSVDKAVNALNQDPTVRARMILAIQGIVDEQLKTTPPPTN